MSLRVKFIGMLVVIFSVYAGIDYWFDQFHIYPGFKDLEYKQAVKNMERAVRAVNNEITQLSVFCQDWAAWNDTYDFVESRSRAYIESNLPPETFTDNNINLIAILDGDGTIVWVQGRTRNTGTPIRFPVFNRHTLPQNHPFLHLHGNPDQLKSLGRTGLFRLDSRILIVAAHPIIKSDNRGPKRGIFIMGRFFDDAMISEISHRTQLQVQKKPPDYTFRPKGNALSRDVVVRFINENALTAAVTLPDITGKPILSLEISQKADILSRGRKALKKSFYYMLTAAALFLVITFLVMEWLVFRRLKTLSKHVTHTTKTGDYHARLQMKTGSDEIGLFADRYNEMMDALEQKSSQMEDQRRFLEIVIDALDDLFVVKNSEGRLVVVNRVTAEMIGKKKEEVLGKRTTDVITLDEAAALTRYDETILDTGKAVEFEFISRRGNQSRIFHIRKSRFLDWNQTPFIVTLARDITESRRAEEALRESEIRYRTFVENFQGIAFRGDMEFRPYFMHGAVQEITGYTESDFLSGTRTWLDSVHPNDRHMLVETGKRLKTDLHYRVERKYRIIRKDNQIRWVFEVISNRTNDKGALAYVEGNVHDITELALAEQRLQESENRFRGFLENFQGIAFRADYDFKPDFLYGAVEQMTGYFSTEFLDGRIIWDQIVHPDDRDMLLKERDLLFSPKPYSANLKYRFIHKNGEIRWVHQHHNNQATGTYPPDRIEGSAYDITDQMAAERELTLREKYYRSVLYAMHDEIIVVDAAGKIIDVNKEYISVVGKTASEIIGRFCYQVFSGFDRLFDRRNNRGVIVQVFQTGGIATDRHFFTSKDGKRRCLDIIMSPLTDGTGAVSAVIVAMRDITTETELENQLHQSRKMEAIGTLAGGIAHDFNNILMSIMLNTEFVLQKAGDNKVVRESLEISLEAAHRARSLVEQILTFSRESEQHIQNVSVTPIVKETLKMLRASLPVTVEIQRDLSPGVVDHVPATPTYIHQILLNLCTNAAHAMREKGGVLTVRLTNETIGTESREKSELSPGKYLVLSVADTGMGIDPSIIDRIFDPFFTTKPRGEGTGMGLSAVHGIVTRLGGAVYVRSAPGAGSTFTVYLPCSEEETFPAAEEKAPPPPGRSRLMIVDDEPFLVESLERNLSNCGYAVEGFTGAIEALQAFRAEPTAYDVVITDQTMPELTGRELAEAMLEIRPEQAIILCTGYSEGLDSEGVRKIGIRRFVMKPVITDDLVKIIEAIALSASQTDSDSPAE